MVTMPDVEPHQHSGLAEMVHANVDVDVDVGFDVSDNANALATIRRGEEKEKKEEKKKEEEEKEKKKTVVVNEILILKIVVSGSFTKARIKREGSKQLTNEPGSAIIISLVTAASRIWRGRRPASRRKKSRR